MKRLFLAGLVGAVAFVGASCETTNCERDCPVTDGTQALEDSLRAWVDITILVLPDKEVWVNDERYYCDLEEGCPAGFQQVKLPNEGPFRITVDEEIYELDAYSPDREPLMEVYVVADPIVLGVYKDKSSMAARATCPCLDCGDGVIVCACNPKCPRTPPDTLNGG